MRELVNGADVLIPLAAVVGAPACERDPWTASSVNLEAVRLLNRLRSPDQLVVFPTTNSGYGTQTGDVFCTEETPLEPISLYGRTKVEAEAAAEIGSDPDKRNYVVSNERLRDAGFEAWRSLDEGIEELLKGYRMMARGPFGNV